MKPQEINILTATVAASRESAAIIALANSNEFQVAIANDSALSDDGWALIAPFGEHPKSRMIRRGEQVQEQKFIQVLDNESADALLSKENSFFRRIRRALVGIPVFKGHPDLTDHAPETLSNGGSKEVIGVIASPRFWDGPVILEIHILVFDGAPKALHYNEKRPHQALDYQTPSEVLMKNLQTS